MIEKDNDKLVEVMDKKLSLLRVCISKNAGLGLMTRIRCTLGICLGKEDRLSKKKSGVYVERTHVVAHIFILDHVCQ